MMSVCSPMLSDLGVLDCLRLIARQRFSDLDFDLARLHRVRHFALELDLQQTVLEPRAFHFDKISKAEAPLKGLGRDAAIQIFGFTLLLVDTAADGQRVLVGTDA